MTQILHNNLVQIRLPNTFSAWCNLYLYKYVEVTNSGFYPTVERAPSIHWRFGRADLKLSTLVAHTTESSRWFQSIRVFTKNEFENWCVLLDGMSKHFVLFFDDVSCLVVLKVFFSSDRSLGSCFFQVIVWFNSSNVFENLISTRSTP